MQRRPLLLLVPLAAFTPPSWPQVNQGLPLRNLLVELRQGDESRLRGKGGGLERGAVIVGPDGQVQARSGVSFESRRRSRLDDAVQQVTVLNGGRAMLHVGTSEPVQWLQWGWSPEGPVLIGGTQFVEIGRGVTVQPRWPGGNAPVTVEVSTEAAARADGGLPSRHAPDGQPLPEGSLQRAGVLTTVQLPLSEWMTVARSSDAQSVRERGVLSTRDVQRERGFVLQMRVTAP